MTHNLLRQLVFLVCPLTLFGLSLAVAQPVVGWWRMDGPIGGSMDGKTIAGALGDGAPRDAVAHARPGGSLIAFHETPGRYIYDPLTRKAYENHTSLRFSSSGQQDGNGSSDYLEIDGGIGKLRPASFTLEGFMKIDGSIGKWHSLVGLRDPAMPHPHAWSLSTENLKGSVKLRYGGHKAPKGYWASFEKNPSVTEAGWHHFAYVFDQTGEKPVARLYWDGQLASEVASPPPPAYTNSQRLNIGGAPGSAGWNGYMDEVRLTAAALTPEQFLQASDTPGAPTGPAIPVELGLRGEAPTPLSAPIKINLPEPMVAPGEVYVPEDAGIIDVKTDYGAKADGMTDDTAAIRRAVAENIGKHRTLYFPAGTYITSEPIDWRNAKGEWNAFLTWQGAGMGRTFIYLRDGSVGFGSADRPTALIRSGSIPGRGSQADGGGNRAHNNYIFDMTFIVGRDNPGAIGVDFNASNTGAMENVRIVALGDGVDGLRLTRQVGPLLIKNVEVHGFDTGIRLAGDLYGSTLTNIRLAGQKKAGVHNSGHMLALQGLVSKNDVPAIIHEGESGRFAETGLLVLIDSQLSGGKPDQPAIRSSAAIVARNVDIAGYGVAVAQGDSPALEGTRIDEYVWPKPVTLFDAPAHTLGLPVVDAPRSPQPPSDQWVSVASFIKDADANGDQSEAIQKAIDSGAAVVYFPKGSYRIFEPVVVRGNVQRLIGYQSWLLGPDEKRNEKGEGLIVFENGKPVSFERFNTKQMQLDVRTIQPVTLRHLMSMPTPTLSHPQAAVWSENTVGGKIAIGPGQSWRAWQLNIETKTPPAMVDNRGGTFWVLGYKTEQGNTVCRTTDRGNSEILGGLWYPAQGFGKDNDPVPSLVVVDSDMSVSLTDMCKGGGQYNTIVQETRNGQTKELPRSALQRKWGPSGSIALYRAANASNER